MEKDVFGFQFGVLDCDGTIIDDMPFYTKVFAEILRKEAGIPVKIGRKFYKETAGMPVLKQYKQILEARNKSVDPQRMAELFFQRFNEEKKRKKFKVFPGTKKVLGKLKGRGIRLFITSGSRQEDLERKLGDNSLLTFFDLVMGSDKIPKGVEHIKIFADFCHLSLEEFAKKSFLVGDGPTDMQIAKEAGIYSIGLATTVEVKLLIGAGADRVVETIKDLEKEGNRMEGRREIPQFKMGDRVKVDFRYLMIIREDAPKTKRIAKVWDVRYYAAINAVSYVVELRDGNMFELFSGGVTAAPEKKKKTKED